MANKELILIVDYRRVRSVEDNLFVDKGERINGGRPQNTTKKFSENMISFLFGMLIPHFDLLQGICRSHSGRTSK